METSSGVCWVFFAADAKPTSMRRALAERLAEREEVLIIDHPVSVVRDRKAPPLKDRWEHLPGIECCYHYRPLHFPERLPGIGRILKLWNQQRLQRELDQLLPRDTKRVVCYDSPTQDHLVGKLSEEISVYLAIDDKTLTVWGEPIHGELEAERRLLSRVDKAVCVSETLAGVLRSRVPNGRTLPIHVLPNGYNERIFNANRKYTEPAPLVDVRRPRILAAGHVSERIDWDGIAGAARLRPQWTWIFLGPADKGMQEKINSSLGKHGFYYPPVSVQDVPAWIHHCDACGVPYRLNPFTRASSPLKAIEYLAMGAPVLSTPIPSLECYKNVLNWVREANGVSYANALDKILIEGCESKAVRARRASVEHDSWGNRVDQFRDFVFNGDASKLQVK